MRIRGKLCIIVMIILLGLLPVMLCAACSTDAEQNPEQTSQLTVADGPETFPPVQVEMPQYILTYSGELKDVLVLKELEGENALEFSVKLSKTEEHIFTLRFDSTEGEFVTVLKDADGNKVPVAFQMAQLPEDLTQKDKNVYLTAQEAVNEIASSLVLKK